MEADNRNDYFCKLHTSLLVERRQSDEANQCMGMIRIRIRPWWSEANLGQSGQR